MLIRIFKANSLTLIITLPFIAVLLWLGMILRGTPAEMHGATMPFYGWALWLTQLNPAIAPVVSILLVVAEAVILNVLAQQFHLLRNQTFLPALLYVIMMCSFPEILFLHPVLFANLFILFALKRCLDLSSNTNSLSVAFDSAFLIGIGSLFYFPVIVFLFFVLVSLALFRSFSLREWIIAALGLLLPYLFIGVYYYWYDALDVLWKEKIVGSFSIGDNSAGITLKSYYTLAGYLILLLIISIPNYISEMGRNKASIRSSLRLFIWLLVLSAVSWLMAPPNALFHFCLAAIPVSILFANFFLNTGRAFAEIVFALLIILIITYQLNYY